MSTTATQLASVRAAIAAIEGGSQSYSIDGMTVTKANLAELYKRESILLSRLAAESSQGGGMFVRGSFGRVR